MFPSDEAAAYYLAALIDGEGHVAHRVYPSGPVRHIDIVNTDRALIEAAQAACDKLGLKWARYDRDRDGDAITPERKHQWNLRIARRESLERAAEILPLKAPAKRDRLLALIQSYPDPRPLDEILTLYRSGLGIRQVAKRLNMPLGTVQYHVSRSGESRSSTRSGKQRPANLWAIYEAEGSIAGAAKIFGVCYTTAQRWIADERRSRTGENRKWERSTPSPRR